MSVTLKNVTLANGKTANVSIDGEHITAVGHDEHGERHPSAHAGERVPHRTPIR